MLDAVAVTLLILAQAVLARISEWVKIGTTIFIVAIDQAAEPNGWGSSQVAQLAKIAGVLK